MLSVWCVVSHCMLSVWCVVSHGMPSAWCVVQQCMLFACCVCITLYAPRLVCCITLYAFSLVCCIILYALRLVCYITLYALRLVFCITLYALRLVFCITLYAFSLVCCFTLCLCQITACALHLYCPVTMDTLGLELLHCRMGTECTIKIKSLIHRPKSKNNFKIYGTTFQLYIALLISNDVESNPGLQSSPSKTLKLCHINIQSMKRNRKKPKQVSQTWIDCVRYLKYFLDMLKIMNCSSPIYNEKYNHGI